MISKNGKLSHPRPKALQHLSARFCISCRLRIMTPGMGENGDSDKITRQYDQIGMKLIHNFDRFAYRHNREMVFVVKVT